MADIELVIKIPKKLVCEGFERPFTEVEKNILIKAIGNGIPLPKGHGRLIDADEIKFENPEFDTYGDYSRAFDAIDQADTIIEADKESD